MAESELWEVKEELEAANRQNLPIVWRMLSQVEDDARTS